MPTTISPLTPTTHGLRVAASFNLRSESLLISMRHDRRWSARQEMECRTGLSRVRAPLITTASSLGICIQSSAWSVRACSSKPSEREKLNGVRFRRSRARYLNTTENHYPGLVDLLAHRASSVSSPIQKRSMHLPSSTRGIDVHAL